MKQFTHRCLFTTRRAEDSIKPIEGRCRLDGGGSGTAARRAVGAPSLEALQGGRDGAELVVSALPPRHGLGLTDHGGPFQRQTQPRRSHVSPPGGTAAHLHGLRAEPGLQPVSVLKGPKSHGSAEVP